MEIPRWLPARLRVALRTARENLEALRRSLTGTDQEVVQVPHTAAEPEPVAEKTRGGEQPEAPLRAQFRDLRVAEVRRETARAVTVTFDNRGPDRLRFNPGQYVTLVLSIDGRQLRRAYSLWSDPDSPEALAITVKRVEGGVVSNWINDNLQPGQVIRTLGPSGEFGIDELRPRARRRLLLVGAGAGITPLYSILQAVTAHEPASRVELIYGNRGWSDVIFREELARLSGERRRLHVRHVLTQPPGNWAGLQGRIAGDNLPELIPADRRAHYYICGPREMMDGVVEYLLAAEVPKNRIHTERFVPQGSGARATGAGTGARVHLVRFSTSNAILKVPDTETVLDAGLAANLALPSSCRMGACGACRQRVVSGELEMEQPNCLTEKERRQGYRLLCVGRPTGKVEIDA